MKMIHNRSASYAASVLALTLLVVFAAPGFQAMACGMAHTGHHTAGSAEIAHQGNQHAGSNHHNHHAKHIIAPMHATNESGRGIGHLALHLMAHDLFCASDCSCDDTEKSFMVSRQSESWMAASTTGFEETGLAAAASVIFAYEARGRHRSRTGPPLLKNPFSNYQTFYARTGRCLT